MGPIEQKRESLQLLEHQATNQYFHLRCGKCGAEERSRQLGELLQSLRVFLSYFHCSLHHAAFKWVSEKSCSLPLATQLISGTPRTHTHTSLYIFVRTFIDRVHSPALSIPNDPEPNPMLQMKEWFAEQRAGFFNLNWTFQWLVLHIRVRKVSWEEWWDQVSHQQSDVSAHGSLWARLRGRTKHCY